MQIQIDTNATAAGPFEDDAAYVQWVVAQAVASWQQQFPGATRDGAIMAARLSHNASLTPAEGQPAPVPLEVTARQARLALLGAGLDGAVEQAIAAMPATPQRRAAQITWEYSLAVQRYNPLITSLGPALGLTEGEIDDLFRAAAAL